MEIVSNEGSVDVQTKTAATLASDLDVASVPKSEAKGEVRWAKLCRSSVVLLKPTLIWRNSSGIVGKGVVLISAFSSFSFLFFVMRRLDRFPFDRLT